MAIKLDQRIRIRLRSFDYRVLDQSVSEIVDTVKRTGAKVLGRFPCQLASTNGRCSVQRMRTKSLGSNSRFVLISA